MADGDYSAAFPWLDEVPAGHRAAAEWAREPLRDDQLEYLRRLPAERRVAVGDELVLACHASPGSQTSGLPADLDAAVTVQRVTRTDARVICCGHTHVADVRELGRKLLVNPGSCGYAFDGTPDACWGHAHASKTARTPEAELHPRRVRRPSRRRGGRRARPARRRLSCSHHPHREVRAMSFVAGGRRVVVTGLGAVTPLGTDVPTLLAAARGRASPASAPSRSSTPPG